MNHPKCDECNNPLGDKTYTHDLVMNNEKFCREDCADKNYNRHLEESLPDDEECNDE